MLTESKKNQAESKSIFWHRHIENCSCSSLTQAQYCKDNSLALATFCYWKKKLKMTMQEKARFYPLTVQPAQQEIVTSSFAGLSLYIGKERFQIDLAENFSDTALKKLIPILEQL